MKREVVMFIEGHVRSIERNLRLPAMRWDDLVEQVDYGLFAGAIHIIRNSITLVRVMELNHITKHEKQ